MATEPISAQNPEPNADQTTEGDEAWQLLAANNIDVAWLAAVMTDAGHGGQVTSIEPSLVGTGQVGENVRCKLSWSGAEAGPDSVVIKLASANETSRAAAEATRTYIREVGFYRDLASSVAIRVPAAYHVSEDRPANTFILVMEDITPSAAGNQLAGCSIEQAELAVNAAADLHGSTWGRTDIAELDWIDVASEEQLEQRAGLWDMVYPGFVDRYAERLSQDVLDFGSWLNGVFREWSLARRDGPQCLVHGDFRLDNLLFGTGEPAPPLTTVDWQTLALGGALGDVAYFLSGSLERGELRTSEGRLLDRYRARLAGHGVELSQEDCLREYRLAAPGGFVMAVIASQLVGQTDRGDDMFMVMANGSASMALDLDTAALL